MTSIWVGPNNGDGQVIDFGMSKSEIEQRRDETRLACDQLGALSELSSIYITEVCDSVGIDAYPLNRALESLRAEADQLILKLEKYY
jgi:hypothetical protein